MLWARLLLGLERFVSMLRHAGASTGATRAAATHGADSTVPVAPVGACSPPVTPNVARQLPVGGRMSRSTLPKAGSQIKNHGHPIERRVEEAPAM